MGSGERSDHLTSSYTKFMTGEATKVGRNCCVLNSVCEMKKKNVNHCKVFSMVAFASE